MESKPPSEPAMGTGVTADEIVIGFAYNSQFDAQAEAGGSPLRVGDQQAQANAVVEAINASGGIAGRTLVVEFYDTSGSQAQDASAATQEACVRFTEDRPVFAAMSTVSQISNDTLYSCLSDNGSVALAGVLGGGHDADAHLERFAPSLYLPAGPTVERLVLTWLDRLDESGYFGGWDAAAGTEGDGDAVIGLIYGSNGDTRGPIADGLKVAVEEALGASGRELAVAFETTGDPTEPEQAVLRLRDAGVTHLIGDAALIGFLPAAAAQNYLPRLGISSISAPLFLSSFAAPGQLAGALGVGFNPPLDVMPAAAPEPSDAATECRSLMDEAGQPTDQPLAWATMTLLCDAFNFLAGALAETDLTPEGLRSGAEAMGTVDAASTFSIGFGGGRADGVHAVRDLGFDAECSCFAYLDTSEYVLE